MRVGRRIITETGTCQVCRREVRCRAPVKGDGSALFPYKHKAPDGSPCDGNYQERYEDRMWQ